MNSRFAFAFTGTAFTALLVLAPGCDRRPDASRSMPATASPPAECGHTGGGQDCTAGASMAGVGTAGASMAGASMAGAGMAGAGDNTIAKQDPATGATILVAGTPLAGATQVKIGELLAQPEAYLGKTVRLEGDVTAMCVHRRGWFALKDPADPAGQPVRVIAAPSFLVPDGSIGKRGRTEGTVELSEVDPEAARHLANDHQVGVDHAAADQPVKTIIIRATGAEFI